MPQDQRARGQNLTRAQTQHPTSERKLTAGEAHQPEEIIGRHLEEQTRKLVSQQELSFRTRNQEAPQRD